MNDGETQVLELFFDSKGEAVEGTSGDKKVIWKDILREGQFPVTPGRKRKIPFRVVPTGASSVTKDLITISMSELMASHEGKAFESVTIPLRHPKPGEEDDVLNNTGFVEGLRVVKKNDKHYMQAGLGFTEPDVAGKVHRGTIPNVSSGIFFNYHNKAQDKTFPTALNHVCLTKHPIMDDLEPFAKIYASDDDITGDFEIEVIELADDEGDDSGDNNDAKVIWNEQMSTRWVMNELRAQLSPDEPEEVGVPHMPRPYYEVQDISRDDTALVEEWFKGDRKKWVIPFDIGDNKVTIAPATRWVEVREAMIAASDDFEGKTYSVLLGKLTTELSDMLGDVGKNLAVQNVSTDGRVAIKDTSNEAVFLAEYVEVHDRVLLSATSEWERIEAPKPKEPPKPKPESKVVHLDTTTPEGRVAAARQQRRQLLSR
jgi:hypothetical protein